MARIIDLDFNDKKYSIEYNRIAIVKLMAERDENDDTFDSAVKLIKCGLLKNHEKDMPTDDDIAGWLLSLGDDLQAFVEALQESVQSVLEIIEKDKKAKNLKWGVRK